MLTFRLPLTFEECYQGRLLDLGDSLSNEYRDIYRDPDTFDVTMPGVSSAFTAQAKEYVDQLEDENHVVHYERAFKQAFSVMQWTDREAPRKILDLGVGSGTSTYVLLKHFPNAQVVACDISAEMLQLARRRLKKHPGMLDRCVTIQLDSEKLTFNSAQFDLVVGAANLHHLFRPQRTIQQSHSLLKEGGCAKLDTWLHVGFARGSNATAYALNFTPILSRGLEIDK